MLVPAKRDGVTSSEAVISRNVCVVFTPFSLVELIDFCPFSIKGSNCCLRSGDRSRFVPPTTQTIPTLHPTLRGCASAKFDWMNVRRGL